MHIYVYIYIYIYVFMYRSLARRRTHRTNEAASPEIPDSQ